MKGMANLLKLRSINQGFNLVDVKFLNELLKSHRDFWTNYINKKPS
jgi:hypothetical protein